MQAQKKQTQNKNEKKVEDNKNKLTPQTEYVEDQGTIAEFGITSLYVFGVSETGEKREIQLSPNFDINVSDYSCSIERDIKSIEIDYEANEYKDLVNAEGLDKDL